MLYPSSFKHPKIYSETISVISEIPQPVLIEFAGVANYLRIDNTSDNTLTVKLNDDDEATISIVSHTTCEFPPESMHVLSVEITGIEADTVTVIAGVPA